MGPGEGLSARGDRGGDGVIGFVTPQRHSTRGVYDRCNEKLSDLSPPQSYNQLSVIKSLSLIMWLNIVSR